MTAPADHPNFHSWLRGLEGYEGQIASLRYYPARKPVRGAIPPGLASELRLLGTVPYSHQSRAFESLAAGANLVIATPTASGKSLTYQLPAITAARAGGTVLYLAPTKALAADQLGKLRGLASSLEFAGPIATYDGDTPTADRPRVREESSIVLSNADMLHYGILPFHAAWARFLARLRYLIIDEIHQYRGVLGTHVANVLRRLLRVARHYGARPQVLAASATIGNPAELAAMLTGEEFTEIVEDGAPAAAREFIFWRPPLVKGSDGRRRSVNSEAAWLAANLVRSGHRSILFSNSRKTAELIRRYAVSQVGEEFEARIASYRAGYTAQDRRSLLDAFRRGDITVLTATSALELGVDVGDVDVVVMVGYPGSVSATWQRIGRAGRGGGRSLAILIPGNDPLDEYYLNNPDLLTEGEPEHAIADPYNSELHPLHADCAAAELPVADGENVFAPWFEPERRSAFYRCGSRWCFAGRYPHRRVRVRGTAGGRIRLVDGSGRQLGESDLGAALRELHTGAVYLHQGENYLVARLDLERREALLLPHIEEYYTQARSETDIEVVRVEEELGRLQVGRVVVSETVTGYVKKRFISEAILDERPLDLPRLSYPTQALWFEVADVATCLPPALLPSALHALEHTLIGLLPAFVLCERADVGGVSYPAYPATGVPTIFIYDGHPGGVGYSRGGAELFSGWLGAARNLLRSCPCRAGCPRCILSPKCGNGNQFLDKGAALSLAEALLGAGKLGASAVPA